MAIIKKAMPGLMSRVAQQTVAKAPMAIRAKSPMGKAAGLAGKAMGSTGSLNGAAVRGALGGIRRSLKKI